MYRAGDITAESMAASRGRGKRKRIFFDPEKDESETADVLDEVKKLAIQVSLTQDDTILLSTDDLLTILVIRFGYTFVEELRLVMTVMPKECGPWRRELVMDLFSQIRKCSLTAIDLQAIDACLSDASMILPPVTYDHYGQVLEKLEHTSNPYGGCLSPPISVCNQCGSDLVKNNKPSNISFYMINGSIPMKKVDLRCRECELNYGITKYGNNKDVGYKYYPELRKFAEASDVCVLDRLVMNTFASLRLV